MKRSGIEVKVYANTWEDEELLDENTRSLMSISHYIEKRDMEFLRDCRRHFFRKNRLLFIKLFLYVVAQRYERDKSFRTDVATFKEALYLAGMVQKHQMNHIHSPWADKFAFVSAIAARFLDIPYSVQVRSHDIHRKKFQYALREKFSLANFVVCNCYYNEAHVKSHLAGNNGTVVRTVYEGINLEKFAKKPTQRKNREYFQVLSVARGIEPKGLDYLLKAVCILRSHGYRFRCEIIGGPEKPLYTNYYVRLRVLHRELGLEDVVHFLGPQPTARVLEANAAADLFVLPCVAAEDGNQDITPNSLMEAMAMESAVISTQMTGIPEIVEDGVDGLLVAPKDEDALADAMARLFDDEDLRNRLGKNARRKVEAKFDLKKNIAQYVELFMGGGADQDRVNSVDSTHSNASNIVTSR